MDNLRKEHKVILAVCAICTGIALFLYFFGNGPTRKKMKLLKREVQDMEQTLAGMGMSGDRASLEAMLASAHGAQDEIEERLASVMACYAGMYRPMIEGKNWTLSSFIQQKPRPSRDLYMREYERIITLSPYGNLDSSSGRIGLNRDSDSEQRWQLLLQLWCVEKLLNTAHDTGLQLVFEQPEASSGRSQQAGGSRRGHQRTPTAGRQRNPVADLAIMPPVEIAGREEKKAADMQKFEFRLGVTGTLAQLTAFVEQLGKTENFFGIGAFEFSQIPPKRGTDAKTQGTLQLNLSLQTFISLKQNEENNAD